MKRYLLFLLLASFTLQMSATVKPREGRGTPEGCVSESFDNYFQGRGPLKIGSQSNAPLKAFGSPKVPVILVQFSDLKFTSGLNGGECTTDEDCVLVNTFFGMFCNGSDGDESYYTGAGSYGAIQEYFRDQSFGLFTPEFEVIGPVTLANGYAYYGKNSGTSKDTNISKFYSDAIKAAQAVYSDWSQFDNDNNNVIDMAFFIYAGEGENGGGGANTIWPKEQASGGTINNVKYGCYACCNETYKGNPDGIGVFVHELSHAMGLPDFYDTNYVAYGLDYFDIMDSGCYCRDAKYPCNYSAYERDFMGWQSLEVLDPTNPQTITLYPISQGGVGYKLVNSSNPNEYLVIENRQTLNWDSYLGKGTDRTKMHGLMVTHVNYNSSAWNSNHVNTNASLQRICIVPADHTLRSYMWVNDMDDYNDFYISTTGDLFPGRQNVTSLANGHEIIYEYYEVKTTTTTDPETGETVEVKSKVLHSYDWSLSDWEQPITDITENVDGSITFNYMGGDPSTAIDRVSASEVIDAPVYNLQGVMVGRSIPNVPGIYIVNGKKVIIRN